MFFFKLKTTYERRISDWSSDVCSSDLCPVLQLVRDIEATAQRTERREAVIARCEAVVPEVGTVRRIEERLALRIPTHAGRDAPVLAEGLLPARLDGMRPDLPVVPVVAVIRVNRGGQQFGKAYGRERV